MRDITGQEVTGWMCVIGAAPFGTIKRSLGYSFFHRRRQENVDAEAASMFIAYNFKRLLSMFSTEELVTKFEESVM